MKYTTAVKDDAQRLLSDLRALGLEAEKLIGNSASEMTDSALSRLREQLGSAQDRFAELYGTARQKTLAAAKHTDQVVRSNPYQAAAAAAGIGLLAGFLIGRSLSHD
jgi:ElaB/YqjD/DUF883 family membrane-anchored ribosome-binding protein